MAGEEMTAPARGHVRDDPPRLIASRYPPVGAFDDIAADKEDLAMAFLLESATNDRLAILSRRLPLLPEREIVQGSGATMVMAAFLHADEAGGRFPAGPLVAWDASSHFDTPIAQTAPH